jgi:hypothetical protein
MTRPERPRQPVPTGEVRRARARVTIALYSVAAVLIGGALAIDGCL